MKHNSLITKKPLLAQDTGGTDGTAGTRKEALINFKVDGTTQLLQAIYNKSLF